MYWRSNLLIMNRLLKLFLPLCALLALTFNLLPKESASASPLADVTTASQLIDAVNSLRLQYGLAPLPVHPILMQTAQSQADYMAATGQVTHTRPGGVSFTQQLLSLGFPLAGDLSLGGFRSENILSTYGPLVWNGVPDGWQDSQHMNTMLSGNFTNIGAGVAQSGDTYYYAVDTAAATGNGQMQESSSAILTSVPAGAVDASQYMVPVTLSTAQPDGKVYHKVEYGQSLWSIAIAYGTTIKQIQALNNLGENSTVYEGQNLLVLINATPAATSTLDVTSTAGVTVTIGPTSTFAPTPTLFQIVQTPTQAEADPAPKAASSRIFIIVLIVAAFVGAGMAVWLIRDPSS